MWNTLKSVSKERYQELLDKGLISESPELKYPRYKRYLDESKGRLIDNIWTDMPFMGTLSEERLGYPTQKPEALLERIISVSSNKGDVVADFFCGCGTTIAVAQKLDRKWIGVDISHLAIRLVYDRLLKQYEGKKRLLKKVRENIKISGFPKDLASARDLAYNTDKSRLQFQDWVVEVMLGGVYNPKRTADGGYDGYLTFNKTDKGKDIILIEVKSGNVSVKNIREFIEVVNKEKASIGTFVCFAEQVTAPMLKWAKEAGYYKPELFGQKYDKIQIITVEEMLAGKLINYPPYQNVTFKNSTGIGITTEEESTTNLFDNSSDEKEYHLI
jgi:site-specific DNA-methyltransferase (adenine-specific)